MIAVAPLQKESKKPAFYVNVSVDKLSFDISEIYARMGRLNPSYTNDFDPVINDIFTAIPDKCRIQAGYILYPVHYEPLNGGRFYIGNVEFNTGKIITGQIKKSSRAAVFACTIGPGMEQWVRQAAQDGDPFKSYLIDLSASLLTEKAVDYLHNYVGKQMGQNAMKITNRYSPGYCDWPVSDQKLIFALLPENFCGIQLNDSAMMTPLKSISGVIGIGQNVQYKDYPCERCPEAECMHRLARSKSFLLKT